MIKCVNCGKDNIEISKFCNQCGNKLVSVVGSEFEKVSVEHSPLQTSAENYVTVIDLPEIGSLDDQHAAISEIPVIGSEVKEPKVEQVQPLELEEQSIVPGPTKAKLTLERGEHANTEFYLTQDVSYIGRWDADNGIFPDVDLDTHDSDAKVSRKHARIIRKEGKFFIEDLGSTNGTFVNRGRRLLPGTPHEIESADEIIVGKTFLRFHII